MFAVALVAACLLILGAWIRPVEDHGLPFANFWENKFSGANDFGVIAVGDSRVLHGLDMEPFTELGQGRVLNFGFRGAPCTKDYFSAAVEQLDEQGSRILVIGITPNGFTEYARHSNDFDQKKREYSERILSLPRWLAYLDQRLQPMTLGEVYRTVRGRENRLQLEFHADGWIESFHADPNEELLRNFYDVHFDNNRALPETVDATCNYLAQCVDDGVKVFAFRPPLSASVRDAEDSNSGFDYKHFVDQFTGIGGVWIEVDPSKFQTYDGSHLSSESARAFSVWLANKIGAEVEQRQAVGDAE